MIGMSLVRQGGHSAAAEQVPSCGRTMKHYEVEIRDAKTREKLCFLDKVGLHPWG